MDTYYEDILNKVKNQVEGQEYQNAFNILEEELSMPYIPREYETKLIAYYNQCRSEVKNNITRQSSDDDIDNLLKGSLDEQFLAIEQLKKRNIRNHKSSIQDYLNEEPHFLVRSYLMEALMEQNITDEFVTEIDGLEVTFTPCYIETPRNSDGVLKAVEYVKSWFENNNPTFTLMCVESLVKEAYLRLPFPIEEDESLDLSLAIAKYVFFANGENEEWIQFAKEKDVMHESGYELLLSKHNI